MTPMCLCCAISNCPGDGCSRTEVVTCDLCGLDCSCGGCLVDQTRRGQPPRQREADCKITSDALATSDGAR